MSPQATGPSAAGPGCEQVTGGANVWAVIAHYGDPGPTHATIASLVAGAVVPARILVIDNQGGFAAAAAEVVRPARNLGFAGAAAEGAARALAGGAGWVWLVNNDATVDAHCLERLLALGAAREGAGILSPVIVYDDDGEVWYAGGSVDLRTMKTGHLTSSGDATEAFATQYITGCAMLVRAAVIEQCGPPDVSLFMYYEDVEWSLRARAAGWEALVVPAAIARHAVPRDGRRRHFSAAAIYLLTRNRLLLAARYGSRAAALPGATTWGLRQVTKGVLRGTAARALLAFGCGVADGMRGRAGSVPSRLEKRS
jgi:GT2 family glycosyltransferase